MDSVNKRLENMIPELEDLVIMNIFTKDEVNKIIKRRREFEYTIQSRIKSVMDYVRYCQYEMNLELLKRKRIKRLNLTSMSWNGRNIWASRIDVILKRALKKYPSDLQLWQQYFEFCIFSRRLSLGTFFSKALMIHPFEPKLWLWAANWEYVYNHQQDTPRNLLLRALRLMPNEKVLFLEHCRFELLFVNDIKEKITPEFESTDVSMLSEKGSEEMDSFISIINSSNNQNKDPILQYEIPKTIYQMVTEKFPDDIVLHQQFLALFEQFPNTQSLQQLVIEHLKKSDQPKALVFSTVIPYREHIIPKKGFQQLDQLISENPDAPQVLLEILNFCSFKLDKNRQYQELIDYIQTLWSKINTSELSLSEDILFTLAHIFLRLDLIQDAVDALKKAKELFPENIQTWYQYIYSLKTLSQDNGDSIDELFTEAFKIDSSNISLILLFIEHNLPLQNYDIIFDRFKITLEQKISKVELQGFCDSVLDLLFQKAEGEFIRKLYSYTLSYFPPSCSFYLQCAHWEATSSLEMNTSAIRKIYRAAIDRYGKTEPNLWLNFIEFETNIHEITTAGTLFWEAKKTLESKPLQQFLVSHTLWQTQSNTTVPDLMESE